MVSEVHIVGWHKVQNAINKTKFCYFKKNFKIYSCIEKSKLQREGEGIIQWLTDQIPSTDKAEPGWSQELEISFGTRLWVARVRGLVWSPAPSQGAHLQGAVLETGSALSHGLQNGTGSVPIRGLTHCATMSTPNFVPCRTTIYQDTSWNPQH